MPVLAAVFEPPPLFQAFFTVEPKLRAQYLRLESVQQSALDLPDSPTHLVEQSACFLELLLVSAVFRESHSELSYSLAEITPEIAAELRRRTIAMCGLDPAVVVDDARRHLQINSPAKPEFQLSVEALVREMKSALEVCPIGHLEHLAAANRIENWGHRCRIAYDGIKAFVLRNSPNQKAQISVLGREYVRGSLSVNDVATLLELHPVDAAALLESRGFNRGMEQIALDAAQRSRILARMRSDRLARDGEPAWTNESIARDVVASERIEGVDARHWITRDGR